MAKKDVLALQKRSHDLGYRIGREEKELQYTEAEYKDFVKRQKEFKQKGNDKEAAEFQTQIDRDKKKIKALKTSIAKDKKEEIKIMNQIRKMK